MARVDRPEVIAVDGPADSGKGTLGRRLAEHFGYAYLDTGQLYRAVAWKVLADGGDPGEADQALAAARAIGEADLAPGELREDKIANAAGVVAANPAVREALVGYQRAFAARPPGGLPGAVIDGRDIGTVICPGADYKIFVDAKIEVRAQRRLKELQERGVDSIYSRVLRDMKVRDDRDRNRSVAPLVPAGDAFVLDTTSLDADTAFQQAVAFISSRDKPDAC